MHLESRKAGRPAARKSVAVVVESSSASGRNIVRGINHYARQHGPWYLHHEWRNAEPEPPAWLSQWKGDGIIARVEWPDMLEALKATGIPVVDVIGILPDNPFPVVRVDDAAISRMAAEHLLERGFRSFAFFQLRWVHWSIKRKEAFEKALQEQHFNCRTYEWDVPEDSHWSWDEEQEKVMRWLQELPKPCGLMLSHDLHGLAVLEACRRGEISVPEEIAIVGVDDDDLRCEVTIPPLSSVMPNDHGVGNEAARQLDLMMNGQKADSMYTLIPPNSVTTRQSSDVLAVEDPVVAGAVSFIREHACEGITVEEVTNVLPICKTLLQRRFKAALGHTIHDEILKVRISHAQFLLEQGDMPLSTIAEKAGFKSQSYLGAVFNKKLNQTPAQYRQSHRLA